MAECTKKYYELEEDLQDQCGCWDCGVIRGFLAGYKLGVAGENNKLIKLDKLRELAMEELKAYQEVVKEGGPPLD